MDGDTFSCCFSCSAFKPQKIDFNPFSFIEYKVMKKAVAQYFQSSQAKLFGEIDALN